MTTVESFAPAKVNLTLHVTGRRPDGYHLLDSLVAFADVGDRLELREAPRRALELSGPETAGVPADVTNSVVQVAATFWHRGPLRIALEKVLPAAAGIGGGSADAAACYRAVARLVALRDGLPPDMLADPVALRRLAKLGADNVMCVLSAPARVRGIGELVEPLDGFPEVPAVLVNPRAPVATGAVFAALATKANPPMPETLPHFAGAAHLAAWLADQRNDLEPPATAAVPAIRAVLDALSGTPEVLFRRMSGSGATCFGLYPDRGAADAAAAKLAAANPDWWVRATALGDRSDAVAPRICA